jgi:hypothetical protein
LHSSVPQWGFFIPKAYAVLTYRSISDLEKLAAYAKLAGPAIAPFGARFLARGNAVVAREQGVKERNRRCRISELGEGEGGIWRSGICGGSEKHSAMVLCEIFVSSRD